MASLTPIKSCGRDPLIKRNEVGRALMELRGARGKRGGAWPPPPPTTPKVAGTAAAILIWPLFELRSGNWDAQRGNRQEHQASYQWLAR